MGDARTPRRRPHETRAYGSGNEDPAVAPRGSAHECGTGCARLIAYSGRQPHVFAGAKKGPFDVHNFLRREWGPAIDSAGVAKPARINDLRSTFASNALAAGITVYELARIMGTSVAMIEAHYGALIDTARESPLERLEMFNEPKHGVTGKRVILGWFCR